MFQTTLNRKSAANNYIFEMRVAQAKEVQNRQIPCLFPLQSR